MCTKEIEKIQAAVFRE